MPVKRRVDSQQNSDISMEEALQTQIGENVGASPEIKATEQAEEEQNNASQYIGTKLTHSIGSKPTLDKDSVEDFLAHKKLTRVGEKIGSQTEIRDGWMFVDRSLLKDRDVFYPEDWQFKIRPATVEAIKNWSVIDENNPNSIDTVFDEILKNCLSITTSIGPKPWYCINAWDRLFFVLLIREYSMQEGQKKISFTKQCPNCDVDVTFELNSLALMYDLPGDDVMDYYDRAKQTWNIIPADYDVEWPEKEYIQLYLPTREKDANIKAYLISRLQEDRNYKADQVFIKFLPWLLPKISKDVNIAKNQIRKAEIDFKSWNIEQFTFMDEVLKNIMVTPDTNLVTVCNSCGEEVTAPMQFPDGISSLFDINDRRKKFGKK